jgi:hypothetical protein
MSRTITNPETGRAITVGGVTYNNLVYQGKISDTSTSNKLKVQLSKKEGPGSRTSGWRAASPRKGKQRHEMASKCPNCFLLPGEEKFPVCPVGSCTPSCKGINAAYVRARQWGYTGVATKARKLQDDHGCRQGNASPRNAVKSPRKRMPK